MRTLLGCLTIVMIGFCLSSKADASTLVLDSGQKIEGQIVEQTPMRITVNVQGIPKTFFLGEIASIDGKKVEIPQPPNVAASPAEIKKSATPPADEESSLMRFMDKRNLKVAPSSKPAPVKVQITSVQIPKASPHNHLLTPQGSQNVVSTPDGGIIVVGPEEIIKYDKDLNVIKEVKIK